MKDNTIKSYYAKSAMKEKKGWKRMSFYKTLKLKHSILMTLDLKCFEAFKVFHQSLLMVNGDNKSKQKNISRTFLFLIRLFQEQTNKLNSDNWLEV